MKVVQILLLIGAITAVLLLVKVGCGMRDLQSANDKLNEELMKANLEIGRAKTEFGDANDHIEKLKEEVKKEIKEREAVMTRYGELEAKYNRLERNKKGQVKTVYQEKILTVPSDLHLLNNRLYRAINEQELKLVEQLEFNYSDHRLSLLARTNFDNQGNENLSLDYDLRLKVKAQYTETLLPSGGVNNYITIWEVDDEGNKVGEFEVTEFTVVVQKPGEKQWFLWAPHIDIGLVATMNLIPPDFVPGGSVGFSFMAYGLTQNDLDWRFIRLSLDLTTHAPGIGFTPVMGNLGQVLPLVSNLWIGPHLIYSPPNEWKLGVFLGAML